MTTQRGPFAGLVRPQDILTRPFADAPPAPVHDADAIALLQILRERIAHPEVLWGAFPGNGRFQPVPAGISVLDIREQRFYGPTGFTPIALKINPHVLEHLQSVTIVADSYVQIDMDPNLGQFLTFGAFIEAEVGKPLERIRFFSDIPYLLLVAMGTANRPAIARFVNTIQYRTSTTVVTKVAAAGTADTLSNVSFVPRFEDSTLVQADFGVNFVRVPGWAQKVFAIRNAGLVDAEVQLYGAGSTALATGSRWVADTDSGGSPATRITIPAGDDQILETSLPWGVMQLRAAAAAGATAGTSTTLVIEMIAQSIGTR